MTNQQMFAVYEACINGNLEKVQQYLDDENTNKEILLSKQFTIDEKLTLLHAAAKKGHCEIMRLLLHHGADVNIKTKFAGNYTPLHIAVHCRNIECIKILLNHDKVDVFAEDDNHKTAYKCSVTFLTKRSDIAKIIKTAEIVQAAKRKTSDLLYQILKNVDGNEMSDGCFSQALLAAISKHTPCQEVVMCILSHVAKLANCRNLDLTSCIHHLCFQLQSFNVKITTQLVLCWMVVKHHLRIQQLSYLLGVDSDYCLSSESSDDFFDLLLAECPQNIQSVREYIHTEMKCQDIAPAINLAITCKHFRAAKLLLGHGSVSEDDKMYDVKWNSMDLESLPPNRILDDMCHHRAFTGKVLQWDNIIRIDLRHNKLTQVPPMIFQPPLLSTLFLSDNQLQTLPELKCISASLNHLYLSHNKLKQLPASLSCSNIRTLKLDDNDFTEVPSCVCKLSELTTLDICDNQIVLLPEELGLLSKLGVFEYDKDKMTYPQGLKTYSEEPAESLIKWLRSLLLKTKPFPTIKLFVIGWQYKGKSTLVRRLRNDLQYFDREITKGVEVSELKVQQKFLLILPKGTRITFQVWDFAGQKDFHLMHMFFLSSVGLYLLVWNLMDGEVGIQELKTWLNNISCKTQRDTKTAVIIVGTHLDCVKKDVKKDVKAYIDNMRHLIENMIGSRSQDNVHVIGIVEVSSHPDDIQGITELKEKIYKASEDMEVLKESVPASFHLMVGKIETLRSTMYKDNELPIVNHDKLRSLMQEIACTKDGVHFEEEFAEAVGFLKDRGIILHFDDPSQDLCDVYFIDPRWLFSLMNHVISNRKTDAGLIRKDLLFSIDSKERPLTENYVTQGIRLLSKFHLVHALDDDYLLMPSRFPEDRPTKKMPSDKMPLRRIYQMEHMPHGFFSRLLARLLLYMEKMITEAYGGQRPVAHSSTMLDEHPMDTSMFSVYELKKSERLQWWYCGLQLNLHEIAVIVEHVEENMPAIKISSLPSKPGIQMLVFIVEHVEAMISEWFHMKDDKVSKLIPCIVCEKKRLEDKHFFKLKECLELYMSKKSETLLKCPKHEEYVLLSDIAPDISLQDFHENLVFESHHLDYDENSFINKGSYGKVFRAVLNKHQTVAVKQYTGDAFSSFNELRKEANILRRINHPNLIQMIGVVCTPRCMMFEFAPLGSLASILFDAEPLVDIPRLVTVYMALEVVDALACLHRSRIIHRDLKPANVLVFSLEEDFTTPHVKVADFGTANFVGPSGMRAPVIPEHIRAPEVLKFALKEDYGTEVDIYSFAMLLFSLVSRKRAFEDSSQDQIRPAVLQEKRPRWRSAADAMSKFANLTRLMCVAWKQNPADRPSAEECTEQLRIPEFQALMSKLAFPAKTNVLFVQLVPSREEVWVVHQTNFDTFLSVFSNKFDSSHTKQNYLVASFQDTYLKICGSNDKIVCLLKKHSSKQGMFKIYTIYDASHPISVNCNVPGIVTCIAASARHIFVAVQSACVFGCLDVKSDNKTMKIHHLTQDPVSKIVASSNRLWIPRQNTIEMYTIEDDTQEHPTIRCSSISIEEVKQLRCFNDAIWVLTKEGFVKLNEQGEVSRVLCFSLDLQMPAQLTCFVPANDTIWVGLDNDEIWILALDTGNLITHFPFHNVKNLLYNHANPPVVISCSRLIKNYYLGNCIDAISPLAIDYSELVQVTADSQKKLCGKRKTSKVSTMTQFEGNWETVHDDKCGDVLIAWQALSCDRWAHR